MVRSHTIPFHIEFQCTVFTIVTDVTCTRENFFIVFFILAHLYQPFFDVLTFDSFLFVINLILEFKRGDSVSEEAAGFADGDIFRFTDSDIKASVLSWICIVLKS